MFEVCPKNDWFQSCPGHSDWCMAGSLNFENGTLKIVESLHALGGPIFDIKHHPEGPRTSEKLCSEHITYNKHIYYIQIKDFHY